METIAAAEPTPVAIVQGQSLLTLPEDLYIPPEALEVFLEAFSGPLDLLLYLIRKQNLDILAIPIAAITEQYLAYIELMQACRLELAAEYLLMAAMLAEIKSRMLLPKPATAEEEEIEDPRMELVRRLQLYEQYKYAAESLDELPRQERDTFLAQAKPMVNKAEKPLPQVATLDLLKAFAAVMKRATLQAAHEVQTEVLSVRERMVRMLAKLKTSDRLSFETLFDIREGRMGIVVTFIALLELVRQSMITVIQTDSFSPIYLKAASE